MNNIYARLSEIQLSPDFKIAKGQPFHEEPFAKYRSQADQSVTLIVEDADENNDYQCPKDKPVLFVKLDSAGSVETINLSL